MRKILYVEDSSTCAMAVVSSFSDWEVVVVKSAGEAIRLLREQEWDAVIIDYLLPDVENGSLIRMIHALHGTSCPIVIYSGRPDLARASCPSDIPVIEKSHFKELHDAVMR